jgi:hypothetical protein
VQRGVLRPQLLDLTCAAQYFNLCSVKIASCVQIPTTSAQKHKTFGIQASDLFHTPFPTFANLCRVIASCRLDVAALESELSLILHSPTDCRVRNACYSFLHSILAKCAADWPLCPDSSQRKNILAACRINFSSWTLLWCPSLARMWLDFRLSLPKREADCQTCNQAAKLICSWLDKESATRKKPNHNNF